MENQATVKPEELERVLSSVGLNHTIELKDGRLTGVKLYINNTWYTFAVDCYNFVVTKTEVPELFRVGHKLFHLVGERGWTSKEEAEKRLQQYIEVNGLDKEDLTLVSSKGVNKHG